jgi:hypothetical protein
MEHHIFSYEEVKLKVTMRKLWEDHSIWMRMFIVDLLSNSLSIDNATNRLLKNQEAIGNCIKPFFGDTAGDTLTSLLKDHVTITVDLLKAIKIGDVTRSMTLETDAVTNTENIATFFATINPCYSKDELIEMLDTNLILVKYQFIARMSGDYNADIMYFDMSIHHILVISDYLFKGIIERFFEEQTLYSYQIQTEYQNQTYPNQIEEQTLDQYQPHQEQTYQPHQEQT